MISCWGNRPRLFSHLAMISRAISQPHGPGWARFPLSSFSLKLRSFWIISPQFFFIFFLTCPPGKALATLLMISRWKPKARASLYRLLTSGTSPGQYGPNRLIIDNYEKSIGARLDLLASMELHNIIPIAGFCNRSSCYRPIEISLWLLQHCSRK